MLRVFLLGAGGHTKQVIDIIKMNNIKISGIFDDAKAINSPYYSDYKILDNLNNVHKYIDKTDLLFCGIGDNQLRKNVIKNFQMYTFLNVISPLAHISASAKINGTGNYIGHFVNLSADTVIGNFNILNDKSCIMHDGIIGDFNHLCPMAVTGGNVKIGNGNLIGTNATVIPTISIGDNNTIGAGAVIIKNVANNNVIVGNPGTLQKKCV